MAILTKYDDAEITIIPGTVEEIIAAISKQTGNTPTLIGSVLDEDGYVLTDIDTVTHMPVAEFIEHFQDLREG